MSPADEVLEYILAHQDLETLYDPVKRHEQYLRTRQLKGRPTNSTTPTRSSSTPKAPAKISANKPKAAPKPTTAEMEKTVEQLKAKLEALRKILADLVTQAKARSGVEEPSDPAKSSTSTIPAKTPQQKAEAAKKAKEYYEKNKDKSLPDQIVDLGKKLKDVAQKIKEAREKLASKKKSPPIANRPVGVGQPKR